MEKEKMKGKWDRKKRNWKRGEDKKVKKEIQQRVKVRKGGQMKEEETKGDGLKEGAILKNIKNENEGEVKEMDCVE